MSNKSAIFIALLCLFSINSANAASVWSTELLFDGVSEDWRLHVVSDGVDLLDPANITGVYLDNVFNNNQIDPVDLLTGSLASIASSDPYDFFSNGPITSVLQQVGLDEIVIKQLDTTGLNGIGQQSALTCREYSCTSWLRHPDGGNRQLFKRPGDPAPQMILTRSALSPVPVPAAVWLFASGLISLIGLARRKKI